MITHNAFLPKILCGILITHDASSYPDSQEVEILFVTLLLSNQRINITLIFAGVVQSKF